MEKTDLLVVALVQEARSWARKRPVSLQGDLCKDVPVSVFSASRHAPYTVPMFQSFGDV
jgi:hypothetical protein